MTRALLALLLLAVPARAQIAFNVGGCSVDPHVGSIACGERPKLYASLRIPDTTYHAFSGVIAIVDVEAPACATNPLVNDGSYYLASSCRAIWDTQDPVGIGDGMLPAPPGWRRMKTEGYLAEPFDLVGYGDQEQVVFRWSLGCVPCGARFVLKSVTLKTADDPPSAWPTFTAAIAGACTTIEYGFDSTAARRSSWGALKGSYR